MISAKSTKVLFATFARLELLMRSSFLLLVARTATDLFKMS
jgi:hypothetical protein